MVILETTDDPTSNDSTEQNSDPKSEPDASSDDHDPSLLTTVTEKARMVSDLVDPFVNLLTLVVQGATVWTLVRKA